MLTWPVVVKYQGEDELLYLDSEAGWQALALTSRPQHGDSVVDSTGSCFTLKENGEISEQVASQLSFDEVLGLVRRHASVCGHCCVSKMGAPGIAEAVALVREIE